MVTYNTEREQLLSWGTCLYKLRCSSWEPKDWLLSQLGANFSRGSSCHSVSSDITFQASSSWSSRFSLALTTKYHWCPFFLLFLYFFLINISSVGTSVKVSIAYTISRTVVLVFVCHILLDPSIGTRLFQGSDNPSLLWDWKQMQKPFVKSTAYSV